MKKGDFLIIGAGPGGYELAAGAAGAGLSVILIERSELGGTCLNRGCIPTKTYCHAAEAIRSAASAASYGIDFPAPAIDYGRLVEKKNAVVGQLREGIATLLSKVDVVKGEARFVGPKTVAVGDDLFTADKIVIATGSRPSTLPLPGAELAVDSDHLLSMSELPRSMAIIGGGVIGMEFASIYSALGVKVSVIEYCKEILPPFDKDIAKRLRSVVAAQGVEFFVNAQAASIARSPDDRLIVDFVSKGKELAVEAEMVVMAVGRKAALPDGLDLAGIATDHGRVVVDPHTLATSTEGVYAVGDVNGLCMLAHAASAQAMRVLGRQVDLSAVPSAVFTDPEAAMVGLTEEACKERGLNYKAVKSLYRANGRAVAMDADRGMVKLIVDPDSQLILGCHAFGPHASDIAQEAALAMANRLPVSSIARTIHAHPTLAEILHAAATPLL